MVTDPDATLTHQEIIERFRKLFRREMTPEEKRIFFLVDSPRSGDLSSDKPH